MPNGMLAGGSYGALSRSNAVRGAGRSVGKKNICQHCYYTRYKIVNKFYVKKNKTVTRQCEGCYNTWDVINKREFDDYTDIIWNKELQAWEPA